MPTDDERRAVARRLREREDELTYDSISLEKGLIDIVGKDGCDYVRRLADLIEPSCDHKALLALAEEFDAKADDIAAYIESCDGYFDEAAAYAERENREHADRIREACGMVDTG